MGFKKIGIASLILLCLGKDTFSEHNLDSRRLLRNENGAEVLYEFENINYGDVEVCVRGSVQRDENDTCYYVCRENYNFLVFLNCGREVRRAGYTPRPLLNGMRIKYFPLIVMDSEKQGEINSLFLTAK